MLWLLRDISVPFKVYATLRRTLKVLPMRSKGGINLLCIFRERILGM